jgi:ribonuclease G
MRREILLARSTGESRGAVLSDGVLTDYRRAAPKAPSLVGAIYRARVKRVLPGLAGAVVETPAGEAWLDLARVAGAKAAEGALLAIEIVQDAAPGKLPRASAEPTLAGRFLVFHPRAAKPRLSHRIADNDARARLGAVLGALGKEGPGHFLALHRAPEADDAMLRREAERLRARWRDALPALAHTAPAEAAPPTDPALDLLRLFLGPAVARVAFDSEALGAIVRGWIVTWAPEWRGTLEREPVGRAALDAADIRAELEAALAAEVPMPGGGALLVESAGGMTVVDVDTERAASLSSGATFARVNREAARAVARQIRLRNLGGRIIVDFAGLGAARDLDAVLGQLRAGVADDPMAVQIAAPSAFGLVELMRRRERRALAEMLAMP